MISELDRLEQQYILRRNEILQKQSNCSHNWSEPQYDPETKKEGYGIRMVHQGTDMWPEYEGYRDVTVPRWSRICSKCGKVEYAYKQRPVIERYEPDFT